MSSSPPQQQVFSTGGTIPGAGHQQLAISNGVLLAAVIFLFMVVVFVFLLYLYAKRYLGANPLMLPPGTPSSSRFVFVDASPLASRGLPAAVLRALPVTIYHHSKQQQQEKEQEEQEQALECAVCLSEVSDGEKVRALPKCGHGFHVECIDMWFHSHDTCPLCRAPVEALLLPAAPREDPADFPAFPTNVLFWGTYDDVANTGLAMPPPPPPPITAASSSTSGRRNKENLVIDIPTRPVNNLAPTSPTTTTTTTTTPLPQSRMADDMRSPVSARLRSLRRLLSRGKQAVVGGGGSASHSSSPRSVAGDIEQGGAEPVKTPKTPKSTSN